MATGNIGMGEKVLAIASAEWGSDPRRILAQTPMSKQQVVALALCGALNALDGFDVLSISFASPGIAAEWHVKPAALGLVLSMEVFGMAAGSVLLGQLADRIGRLSTTILCLVIMAIGMLATPQSTGVGFLTLTRLFTGLGIGGMLAATNALAAEYTNARWRSAGIAIMAAGYPLGAVIGGTIASRMLVHGDWRNVFYLGAGLALVLLPLVPLLMREPVGALLQRRPANALSLINRTMRAFGHDEIDHLPDVDPAAPKIGLRDLFGPKLGATTGLLAMAYFTHIITFYFVVKWIPKIVVNMGFAPSAAGGVLVWANVGGLIGALLFSLASLRLPLRGSLVAMMLASAVMVAVFGHAPADLTVLSLAAAGAAFCTNSVIVGFYALIAQSFPTPVRGGGTGFVIGVGRFGSAAGPITAGALFQAGLGLPAVAALMAVGSLIAAGMLLVLPRGETQDH